MKKLLMTTFVAGLAFVGRSADLTVAAGETVDVTAAAAYDTVTVNGTLNVSATLTFTSLYVASGAGTSGALNVIGSGTLSQRNTATDRSIYIGYNGGNGTLKLASSKETAAAYLVLGHGGGECTFDLQGKYFQGWCVRKLGSGIGHMQFNGKGAYLKLSSDSFIVEEGTLSVESVNGNSIDVRFFNSGSKAFASGDGKLVIKGSGGISSYSYLTAAYAASARYKLQGPTGGVDWSEFTGAFGISGSDRENPTTFQLTQDGFLNLPSQSLQLNSNQKLDLNGHSLTALNLTCWSDTTNFDVFNSAEAPAEIAVSTAINSKIALGENINLRKFGSGTLTYAGSQIQGSLIVDEGGFAFSNDATVTGDIIQNGTSEISLPAGKALTIAGSRWSAPRFASGSQGNVTVASDAVTVFDTPTMTFPGNVSVTSGNLVIGQLSKTSPHRYFRLTFMDNYDSATPVSETDTAKDIVVVSEFQLLDADGNRLNANLKGAAAGTEAKDLKPGTCCYAANYAEGVSGVSSQVANLFDTYVSSCVYFTGLGWQTGSSANAPRVILFRLADDQVADVSTYQLFTSNKTYVDANGATQALAPLGNVTQWKLEGSSDGVRWQVLDARVQRAYADQTVRSNTAYVKGPYSLTTDFVTEAASVALASGAKVSLAPGAGLDVFAAQPCELGNLELDCSLPGVATISGCALDSYGNLYLTNVPMPFTRVSIPLALEFGTHPEYLANWSAFVNGEVELNTKIKLFETGWKLVRQTGLYILFN